MKTIKSWLGAISLVLVICGVIYGYGKLNEMVDNNIDNIRRNEQIIENQMIRVESELKIVRSDCSTIKGDIREIKGYLRGYNKK